LNRNRNIIACQAHTGMVPLFYSNLRAAGHVLGAGEISAARCSNPILGSRSCDFHDQALASTATSPDGR
jgi:hypothetical protein